MTYHPGPLDPLDPFGEHAASELAARLRDHIDLGSDFGESVGAEAEAHLRRQAEDPSTDADAAEASMGPVVGLPGEEDGPGGPA